MNRTEFIETMQDYVEKLKNERSEVKNLLKTEPDNYNLHHMASKIGYEISAIENAIREMQRQ